MTVTPLYAAVLALLYVLLSVRVIGARRQAGVAIGDGGDKWLLRRQRVHANFAEYVPLALVLMMLAEQQGVSRLIIHGLGLALLLGRAIHAFGVSREPEQLRLRVLGMALTFTVLMAGALVNLAGGAMLAFAGI